jgi:gamma-glutamylputrescine oxidase
MFSFWERESLIRSTDIGIIGSGIVGLSAALTLRELYPHLSVTILERGFLPQGASTRNAGFATFGTMTEIIDDLKNQSESTVFELVERRFRGLRRLRERVGDRNLQYEAVGGHEIFRDLDVEIFKNCVEQVNHFNHLLKNITGLNNTYQIHNQPFNFKKVHQIIKNVAEGQLHTGKMIAALQAKAQRAKVQLLYGVNIKQIEDNDNKVELRDANGYLFHFQKVIVATNGFARQLLPKLPVVPARNHVLITKPFAKIPFRGNFQLDRGYFYFRNVGNRILLGGGRNLDLETEATDIFAPNDLITNALNELLKNIILPNQPFEIEQQWSGILGLAPKGVSKKPIIEKISPNVTVSVRMGGMGIAIGSLVGEEAAKLAIA